MDSKLDWAVTLLAMGAGAARIADFEGEVRQALADGKCAVAASHSLIPLAGGSVADAKRIAFSMDVETALDVRRTINELSGKGVDAILHSAVLHWSQFKLAVFDLD